MVYTFKDQHLELDKVPGNCKKITATRFATIMGLNAWSTPFEAWCAITRTYEAPFEDTKYTKAGKTIEPKVIEYLQKTMFMDLKTPTDVYGQEYFKKTRGDFFPNDEVLGGMWDVLGDDFIVEIKTTKRAEDWMDGAPIYYKLQAALYAYLCGFDKFIMTVSFLEESDYDHPEKFKVSVKNTKTYEYSMAEEFPDFEERYIEPALNWWKEHVKKGISPDFDEKADAEILKELRKKTVVPEDDEIASLLKEADQLMDVIEATEIKLEDKKARLKEIDDQIKRYMSEQFKDGDKSVIIHSPKYTWTLTKSTRSSVDSNALKKAGIYEQYLKQSTVMTLKKTLDGEE